MRKVSFLITLVACLILVIIPAVGQSVTLSRGQIVYAPAAHNCIRWDDNEQNCIRSIQTGLTIRNIDLNFPITLISIQIYDPDGNFHDELLKSGPLILDPLASIGFRTAEYLFWNWIEGGRPSFIVRWKSNRYVNAPIIETGRVVLDGYGYGTTWQAMDITSGTVLKEAP